MPQIRLALIGLSAGAKTSWAEQGHLPYLLSARGRSHYELAGLLNSNVGAGEAAKKHFQLPPAVKVYGDAAALAADPDIDLVVCCTRVDVHYQTLESVARAGKAIYVEWPVAENHARAVSLWNSSSSSRANAANNSMVGLQGRLSPVVRKLKQVLRQGQIGRVLSSDVRAFNNVFARDALPAGLSYFAERAVGGNLITILYAHTVDLVHEVLGEFEDGTVQSRMQVQRPVLKAITTAATGAREAGSEDFETITSDVPDLLVIHGALAAGKQDIAAGATLSATFRSGQPFKGAPAFVWTINGEKGELRVTSSAGPYLQSYSYTEPVTIELHVYETDEVVTVDWDWDEWQKELPARGRLVADVYERYADWNKKGSAVVKDGGNYSIPEERIWPRIPDAVVRHREIEALFERYDA
jgi:predicted dehydrogenase